MKKEQVVKDERLELIQQQLERLTQFDFGNPLQVSDNRDDIDEIIIKVNALGEEIKKDRPK